MFRRTLLLETTFCLTQLADFIYLFFSYQLAGINPGIDMSCSNLLPEEALCLGTEDEDCNETYVVKPDDTCDIVADAQGVNSTMVRLKQPSD